MLVIHTLNWIHICMQSPHFGFGPFLTAVLCYLAQQWFIEDVKHHTLPILFFFASMLIALLYRANDRYVDLVYRLPDSLNMVVGSALYLAFDVIWTPYMGLGLSMLLNRIIDHVYFSAKTPRLAWSTTAVLIVPYLFIASTHMNSSNITNTEYYERYLATQNACTLWFLVAIIGCILLTIYLKRSKTNAHDA